jgi:hypothetical protein
MGKCPNFKLLFTFLLVHFFGGAGDPWALVYESSILPLSYIPALQVLSKQRTKLMYKNI